ncbi:MAG: tetratricopeptide repeat protein [Treponema sp.]|jgi:tetratricopeptide (TPR) repeat protein|nr:tetratricopeptide repeat protein [Treponema sp.]
MLYDFKENRQIRIFISSTFRDMMQERDYLITRVFPELRRYCDERDISLFELDLRWGVTQEESENQMAFKICLNEVDNTRPFFIGLLGERYGWVPDEETQNKMKLTKVFDEYEWLPGELKKKKSITETEIQEGAFLPEDEINAYFYLRSPKMDTPQEFREDKGSHGEKMLLELKDRIRKDKRYAVKDYDGVEHLGNMIEKDFKAIVDKLFPGQGHLSGFEKERLQQYIFLKSKTRAYVTRHEWMEYLDKFADGGERAAAVTGESGIGKCALLANWIADRQKKQIPNEKIIYHFTGVSQSEGDYQKITRRFMDEVRSLYNFPVKEENALKIDMVANKKNETEDDEDDPEFELQELLFAIPEDQKLIIVLDSLDSLDDTDNAKMLNWLPAHPGNVKFIFSAVSGDKTIEALERRTGNILELDSLPEKSRRGLIVKYFEKFSKKLSAAQMERIISDKKSENPAVLTAILDNLRIFGNFDIFDKQIEERLSCHSGESLFDLFLQNIESVFNEAGATAGSSRKSAVKDILSLLALSRRGLTETEIVNISKVPKLYWSQLSNCMSAHLKTINGFVTFSGGLMLNAVKNRYLKDSGARRACRLSISAYMESGEEVSFNRKCGELPFQLMELKDYDRLYGFLLDKKAFDHIYAKDKYELGGYWRALREHDMKRYKMEKYLELDIKDKEELTDFLENISSFINNIIIDPSLALVFAQKHLEVCEEYFGKDSAKTAVSYIKIGSCYGSNSLRDYNKALEYFINAGEIYKKVNGKDHYTAATVYCNIGSCYGNPSIGKYDEAVEYYTDALDIIKKEFGEDENSLTAVIYGNIGQCYINNSKPADAVEYCYNALKLCETFYGREHPKTAQSYYVMGELMYNLQQFAEAVQFLNTFLNIWINFFGEEHLKIAETYNNIGFCYMGLKENEKAVEASGKAIKLFMKIDGENTDRAASAYFNAGMCFHSSEDYGKAVENFGKYISIVVKNPGTDPFRIAYAKSKSAACYYELGEYEKALPYYNDALAAYMKKYGGKHLQVGIMYDDMAVCYDELEDYDNALSCYKKAISVYELYDDTEDLIEGAKDSIERIGSS